MWIVMPISLLTSAKFIDEHFLAVAAFFQTHPHVFKLILWLNGMYLL